jgi:hypothetical protein
MTVNVCAFIFVFVAWTRTVHVTLASIWCDCSFKEMIEPLKLQKKFDSAVLLTPLSLD